MEEELGVRYDFRFLALQEAESSSTKPGAIWFRASDILAMKETYDLIDYLQGRGIGNDQNAGRTLGRLHRAVHADRVVHYYQEESADIERVLNIFIRVNSGGTILSYSDLLLSLATAQWKDRDARRDINELIDELNDLGQGFNISKELVLKTGLVLLESNWIGLPELVIPGVRSVAVGGQVCPVRRTRGSRGRLGRLG